MNEYWKEETKKENILFNNALNFLLFLVIWLKTASNVTCSIKPVILF